MVDFEFKVDRIGLGGDLTYDQLEIINGETDKEIDSIFYNGDLLAVVVDKFNDTNLSAADFIEF